MALGCRGELSLEARASRLEAAGPCRRRTDWPARRQRARRSWRPCRSSSALERAGCEQARASLMPPRGPPLQRTGPSSATSRRSFAPGIEPLRCTTKRSAAGLPQPASSAAAAQRGRDARRRLRPPPRRRRAAGSPPPVSQPVPVALDRLDAAEEQVELAEAGQRRGPPRSSARDVDARLGVDDAVLEVQRAAPRRRRATSSPWSTTPTIVCRIAERIRLEPAAAEHQLDAAVAQHDGRGHHARHPPARRVRWKPSGFRSCSPMHVVEVDAGAGHDDARALAVRAGHRSRRRPSASSTEMCVVEPSARPGSARGSRLGEAVEELRRALAPAPPPSTSTSRSVGGAGRRRSSSASA